MIKVIFVSSFLLLLIIGCHRENNVQSVKDAPEWLKSKIDTMLSYQEYEGTRLYHYKWNGADIYHFEIPNSTCLYCAMYLQSGDTLLFSSETEFQDFLRSKTDSTLIWEWPEKL
jgi:hypothetical protein